MSRYLCRALFLWAFSLATFNVAAQAAPPQQLELSRGVRSWEFLPVVGQRAALFGAEGGRFEAWVYPLKVARDIHFIFHVDGRAIPAETLARTLVVRPESATIVYAGDTFSVRETLFVPVHDQGAVVAFDIETAQPFEVEARFVADLQLMWPAALGGTYQNWDEHHRAFVLGEEQRKFSALVGSPTGDAPQLSFQTNYSSSDENSLHLGITQKGRETKLLVLAGSVDGFQSAAATYERLLSSYDALQKESAEYYSNYLASTVNLDLPDRQLQSAYDWSRISTIQGLATNPFLGTGLVAGYRTSGTGQRPGFAWFFGRDSLWTSFALNSAGDFQTSRTALEFVSKFQRDDGKIPHEISQGANFVDWFKDYPYPYAAADATPLFIIAFNDYVVKSGDVEFAKAKWDNIWRAYQFLRSTYDSGVPKNLGIGHGWVEGGPLLPIKSEFYHSGLAAQSLQALSNLARLVGREDVSQSLAQDFARERHDLNSTFWSDRNKAFSFAIDNQGKQVEEPTVLTTVPMWFGVTDDDKAQPTINRLAGLDHQTDWGMRIISNRSALYGAGGYHYGSVWPLFTGWASVGEYRYHRPVPAYLNLRSNAQLALDGSLGHVTEVLSGDYYQGLSTSSPHQIWSAAMVVSPILRGMLGLDAQAATCTITLAPHLPADWTSFGITGLRSGTTKFDVKFQRSTDAIELNVAKKGGGTCSLDLSLALSLRAQVTSALVDGRKVSAKIENHIADQHAVMSVPLTNPTTAIRVSLKKDFAISIASEMPPLGSPSQGLRVTAETWNEKRSQLTLELEGESGKDYAIDVWNPAQVASVEGGKLSANGHDVGKLVVQMPSSSEHYARHTLILHFSGK